MVRHAALVCVVKVRALQYASLTGRPVALSDEPTGGDVDGMSDKELMRLVSALDSAREELLADPHHLGRVLAEALVLDDVVDLVDDDDDNAPQGVNKGPHKALFPLPVRERVHRFLLRRLVDLGVGVTQQDQHQGAQAALLGCLSQVVRPPQACPILVPALQQMVQALTAAAVPSSAEAAAGGSHGPGGGRGRAGRRTRLQLLAALSFNQDWANVAVKARKPLEHHVDGLVGCLDALFQLVGRHSVGGSRSEAPSPAVLEEAVDWLGLLLAQLVPPFYAAVGDACQQRLLKCLLRIAVGVAAGDGGLGTAAGAGGALTSGTGAPPGRAEVAEAARARLRLLPLPVDHVSVRLDKLRERLADRARALGEAKPTKSRRKESEAPAGGLAGAESSAPTAPAASPEEHALLDALQTHSEPARFATPLLPCLFGLLAALCEQRAATSTATVAGDESLEQSILGAILVLLDAAPPTQAALPVPPSAAKASAKVAAAARGVQAAVPLGEDQVDAVVGSVRGCESPQTRHQALAVLARLALLAPKAVTKGAVLAVCSHLLGPHGAPLRPNDAYAFHLVEVHRPPTLSHYLTRTHRAQSHFHKWVYVCSTCRVQFLPSASFLPPVTPSLPLSRGNPLL